MPIKTTTPAREDYLKAIFHLGGEDRRVPTSELARALGVRNPSITGMLRKLGEEGLVSWRPRRGARLSARGRAATMNVLRRHRILETFLVKVVGIDWSVVHEEAEILEHHVSARLVRAMDEVLGHPTEDPHGAPIPPDGGDIETRDLVALSSLTGGESATVREVDDRSQRRLLRWKELGLVPGAPVEMAERRDEEGLVFLLVAGEDVLTGTRGVQGIRVERHASRREDRSA